MKTVTEVRRTPAAPIDTGVSAEEVRNCEGIPQFNGMFSNLLKNCKANNDVGESKF